ncbi:MAG: hypothetical protein AAF433_17660 [Bacteroidota bacterium]
MIRYSLLIVCLLGFGLSALAQQNQPLDRLHLKDGRKVLGQLIAWDYDGSLSFRDSSGRTDVYQREDYSRVTFSDQNGETTSTLAPALSTEKSTVSREWYQSVEIGFTLGREEQDNDFFFGPDNDAVVGYQLALQMGRHLSDRWRLGLVAQYSSYSHSRRERTVGAGLQARFVATQPEISPSIFIQMEGAYELPIGSGDQEIMDVEGGFAVHPSVGILLGPGLVGGGRISFDVGYRFLQTTYRANSFRGSELRTPSYRRLVLRAAYQF